MNKHTNPLAQKIIDLGGTVLPEPLFNEDGSINPEMEKQLFNALERPKLGDAIRNHLRKSDEGVQP